MVSGFSQLANRPGGRNKRQAIREALRDYVRDARLRAGERIASTHELVAHFGASYVTTHSAMDDLVKEGVLVRIQGQGTFVADAFDSRTRLVRIALPCSEQAIDIRNFGVNENWGIVSEQYRGMHEEAREQHAEIDLIHVRAARDEIDLAQQVLRVGKSDGALFFDPAHDPLRERLQTGSGCFTVSCKVDPSVQATGATVYGDRQAALAELADHLARRGYRRLWVLVVANAEESTQRKIGMMRQCAANAGLAAPEETVIPIGKAADAIDRALSGRRFEAGRDAVFCAATDHIAALYRACLARRLRIGRDLALFGYGSGFTFINLVPSLTYSRVDHYGMGRMACRMIVDAARNGRHGAPNVFLPNTLVIGEST